MINDPNYLYEMVRCQEAEQDALRRAKRNDRVVVVVAGIIMTAGHVLALSDCGYASAWFYTVAAILFLCRVCSVFVGIYS